jgi:hypothetical protein
MQPEATMVKDNEKPYVWTGHIEMETDQLEATNDFFEKVGMRSLIKDENFSILELRAGTHLVLDRKDTITSGAAKFDLMVEDIDEAHARMLSLGLKASDIERGSIHDSFVLTEPAGHRITVNSSHNSGLTV